MYIAQAVGQDLQSPVLPKNKKRKEKRKKKIAILFISSD
jgi:hypothetical protein